MDDTGTTTPDPDSWRAALANQLMAPFSATPPAYKNPQFTTPAQLEWNRKLAQQMMQPMQVHRPMEGVANLFKSVIGGNEEYQADQASQAAQGSYLAALGRVSAAARGDTSDPSSTDNSSTGGSSAPLAYAQTDDASSTSPAPKPGFDGAVNRTLGFEGGYNAQDANGSPVNYGINQGANPDVNVANLTPDQAKSLYKSRYWDAIGGDNLSPALSRAAFDTSVMAGPGRANDMIAASGGDPNKFMDLREQYLGGLVNSDPAKYGKYAQAWADRNAGLRSDIAAMSGNSASGGNAVDAIGSVAPQNGSGASTPTGTMAFSGPQSQAGGMLGAPPPGYRPPGGMPPDQRAALAHVLIHGPQATGPSPQDLAIALGSPFGTAEGRAVASHMITPTLLSDSNNNQLAYRNGQQPQMLVPGARVQTIQVGGQNVPISISGDPRNPSVTVLAPSGDAGGSPPSSSGVPAGGRGAPAAGSQTSAPASLPADRPTRVGPLAGYGPLIEQGQGISAQGAAAEHAGAASGDQYARDRATAGDYATSMYPLQQAAQALDALGPQGSGPGTEGLNRVKSILQSAGFPGFDASKIQNYDDARQFIAGYVGQHGGTSKLVGAFSGDPTTNVSNAAASDLVKSALSLQRMQQAKVAAFRQSGLPESKYSDFASDFASRSDPRAYGIDQMSDAAKQKLYASMPAGSPERARFAASVRNAMQTGMITQPAQPRN